MLIHSVGARAIPIWIKKLLKRRIKAICQIPCIIILWICIANYHALYTLFQICMFAVFWLSIHQESLIVLVFPDNLTFSFVHPLYFLLFYCCCCSCCYCCAPYFERLPFSWAIFTHLPSLSYFTHFTCSVYVDTYTFYAVNAISRQHGQRKQNYNDATRPSTVHSHIYTYSCRDARLYSYILHNFTLCTSSETSFARAFSISFAASPSLSLYVIHTVRPTIFAIIYN